MNQINRQSPIRLDEAAVVKTETIDRWRVVQRYKDEGYGPWISDLSHLPRWDLQDRQIDTLPEPRVTVPPSSGMVNADASRAVSRMNATQAVIWDFSFDAPVPSASTGLTDITDAQACLAIYGPDVFSLMEKLTTLDVRDPLKTAPFLVQGPVCHVPCQVLVIQNTGDLNGLAFAFSRGYAADMVDAVMRAGKQFSLRPAGYGRFIRWVQEVF